MGASVCVNVGGETVVDLWGGRVAAAEDAPAWTDETISLVFSCTKAATALCAHMLIDRGELDLHAPVGTYWPEFATNGKEHATVEMMLNHSVGLPALRETVKDGRLLRLGLHGRAARRGSSRSGSRARATAIT